MKRGLLLAGLVLLLSISVFVSAQNENYTSSNATIATTATTQPTCIDSDGGLNYYIKGSTIQNGTTYGVDQCEIHGNDSISVVRECTGSNCFLLESLCSSYTGSTPSSEFYSCPNGCTEGACINYVPSVSTQQESTREGNVHEQVECVFRNSDAMQKCYSGNYNSYANTSEGGFCAGIGTCSANVSGHSGENLTWKSTCERVYAYTYMNGEDETIVFNCAPQIGINETEIRSKGFRFAYWECYNGENQKGTELNYSTCQSSEAWQSLAVEFCKEKCKSYGDVTKCGVNSFGVTDECFSNSSNSSDSLIAIPLIKNLTKEFGDDVLICKDSCPSEGKCYPFGYRKTGEYCSDTGQFIAQLESDNLCDNNFQCSSNVCVNSACISPGFLQSILDFFRTLFGIK